MTDQPKQATIEQPKQASISLTLAEIEDLIPVLDFEIAGQERSMLIMAELGDEEPMIEASGYCDRLTFLRDRFAQLAEGFAVAPAPVDPYDPVAFEAELRIHGALPKSFKIVDGYIVVLADGSIDRSTLSFQGGQAAIWWTCDFEELFGTSGVAEAGERIGSEFTSSYFLTATEIPTKMARWHCIDQASRTFQYHREVAAGVRNNDFRN